jgi:hypothetical protein
MGTNCIGLQMFPSTLSATFSGNFLRTKFEMKSELLVGFNLKIQFKTG